MALNIFLHGLDTEDDVLEIRDGTVQQMRTGIVTSWSSENVSVTKIQGISLEKILNYCNEFLKAENPETYGRTIKRSRPSYF